MAKYKGYKLHFRDGLHIDAGGFGMANTAESIASDTLMSAICCCVRLLFDDSKVTELLNTEGAISSAFPFQNDVLYFPKPLTSDYELSFSPYSDEKRFRKARFLTNDTFSKSLSGTLDETAFETILNGKKQHVFPSTKEFMQTIERPRVAIDRINSATTIFPFAELVFDRDEKCGFFFLTDFKDPSVLKTIFEPALRLLGDEGIGADGTIGKGLFEVEAFDCTIELPDDSNAHLLLSLYNPNETETQELNTDNSTYDFVIRNGWISSGSWETRRQSVRMIREGSVLSFNKNQKPIGCVPNVVQGSDVFRWGRAFTLPIKLK
jgi:CRISPR-associated protein Csm4